MKTKSKNLSKREREVVERLLQGKSNKQIAFALRITESTVEFHLKNIYAKLGVSSRTEAILKLGKSTSWINRRLRESIVDLVNQKINNGGEFILWPQWILFIKKAVSTIKKEIKMKNRLFPYFLAGLVFGVLFLFYFEVLDRFMNTFNINKHNVFAVWAFISIEFLLVFGVWLIPTIYAARHEFRHSNKVTLSAVAVIVSWVSAVFGYHLTHAILLAFIGLPKAQLFPLILFKFLQWTLVSIILGGFAGLVTSWLYSIWVKKPTQRCQYNLMASFTLLITVYQLLITI